MSKHEPVAISLRPPSGVAAPELGPLVRAQPIEVRGRSFLPFAFPLLGVGTASLLQNSSHGVVFLGLATALIGTAGTLPAAQAWWRRRRLRRCPRWDGTGAPPVGVVRVTGRLRALGEPFLTPGESQPVVYSRTRFRQADPYGRPTYLHREDVRGLFLEVELPGDACVRIAPETVVLLEHETLVPEVGSEARWKLGAAWEGWWRGKLRRSILRAGDTVEAVGQVVREVNDQGVAGPGRGVPMMQWLVPAWNGGVWIRKLERT